MKDVFGERIAEQEFRMADYLDQSAYDEKFEINVEKDLIRNIYHVENKYYVPVMTGSFRDMYEFGRNYMVHPDDHNYHQLMEPDTILDRLKNSETPGMIKADCREKLVDGSYRWVQYIGISGENHGVPEGLIYFYVFDIQNQRDRQSGKLSSEYRLFRRDQRTGLHMSEQFIPEVRKLVENETGSWCCLAIDIQHFKVFNDWFGYERGNYVLARIGTILLEYEQSEKAAAAYFGRDNFGLFCRHDKKKIDKLYNAVREVVYSYSNTVGFLPAFGIHLLEQTDHIDLDVYEKARVAVEDAKMSYTDRIRYFDSQAYNRRKEEYALLTEFQHALQNQEIGFYVQPQCRLSDGKIIGLEALARWIKEDGTMISPGRFVPFLENNGFVTDLDKCVWEKVCCWIRELMNKGIEMLPVSMNVSVVDLLTIDVPAYLYGLTERYNVPARLLKVEITESAFAENYETIPRAVTRFKEKGFSVHLDDFGSGYSSLNMLDKMNADVLKLDMAFIRKESGLSRKRISILEAIVSMTNMMNIPMIVEGVENEEQISLLRSLGCRYIQGYYFYRPMPAADCEQLLLEAEKLDFGGIQRRGTELFHSREFLNEGLFTDVVLNKILGPVAFYTQSSDGSVNITRFNQQFYECIADDNMESRQTTIQNYIVKEDHPAFQQMLEDAFRDTLNGGECTVRFYKSRGGTFWYNLRLYFLTENEQGRIYFGKIAYMPNYEKN